MSKSEYKLNTIGSPFTNRFFVFTHNLGKNSDRTLSLDSNNQQQRF